jgi:hypothetical protein
LEGLLFQVVFTPHGASRLRHSRMLSTDVFIMEVLISIPMMESNTQRLHSVKKKVYQIRFDISHQSSNRTKAAAVPTMPMRI